MSQLQSQQQTSESKSDSSPPPPQWSLERLNKLPFQRNDRHSAVRGLKLPGKRWGWADERQVREVWRLFWRAYPNLNPARKHTTVSMCADPAWAERNVTEKRRFGRCFRYLANAGVLPINLVETKWPPLKYVLTPFTTEIRKAA